MQVFKACFKVIRKNLPSMMIYFMVFLFLMLLLTLFYKAPADDLFHPVRPRIAVFNEDAGDPFSDGLQDWLGSTARVIVITDEQEKIQDALFYRDISYILRIPAGFGNNVLSGQTDNLFLDRTLIPDSWEGITMDLLVERYVNLSALFAGTLADLSVADLNTAVQESLAQEATLQLQVTETRPFNRTSYYFTYMAYAMMAVMILGITSVLLVFNQADLRSRNLAAPVNLFRFNGQLVLGLLLFAIAAWLVMFLVSLAMDGYQLQAPKLLLFGANALAFTLACLSIAFLISQFIRSRDVQQSIANVLALGTSFISGVFVPQEMLGDTVQTLASFTPTYWYILAINEIDTLPDFSSLSLQPTIRYMLIQLGFAIALLAVAMAVIRQKRQTRS
jgi:ABC-2 type transport system permease protein